MAESAVLVAIGTSLASGLLKSVLQKSVDALSKTNSAAGLKSAILGNLEPQLLHLERELRKLDSYMCCADSLNLVQHNRNDPVLLWLKRVREAANFADNLLEDILYDQLRRQAESNMVTKLFRGSDGTSFAFRRKIGSKLSKFETMTCNIYKEAAEIGLRPADWVANPASYQLPAAMSTDLREMRENVDTSIVVGRQLDEDLIVGELSRTDNVQVSGVIAIVGMSGVGKTTLARKIYDNDTVRDHFKKKTWIFVSQDFNLRRLLDEMLQSLTGENHNLSNIGAMEMKLQGCLQRERYLLVLDDVWNTDMHIWDSVRTSLVRVTGGCTGSMVLVTAQSVEVASVMGASLTHTVNVLSKDDAWTLFEIKAFANKSHQQVSDLRDIGERILKKCGGLPLAINTLGSLLGSMNKRSQWESVDRSEVWNLSEGETKIMPWLLLSFNHLPSASVKQCFAHCSVVIRKGFHTWVEALMYYWIAHGFIKPLDTSLQSMMATGRLYINSMVANGLLQPIIRDDREDYFTMHDLIHDLALYVSRDTCLVIRDPNHLHNASSEVEHLSIYGGNTCNSQLKIPEGNRQSTLRTLILNNITICVDLVAQARFLRQLQLEGCGLKEIPRSIGRLKHLRILKLDDNPVEYLPESIGRLYNLHVLTLARCVRLVELPQQITKLLSLKVIATTVAVAIPKGMGQLTCLTHLPRVKLKARDGCKIKELGSLPQLKGKVVIKQLENLHCKEDAVEAGLKFKERLKGLELVWTNEGHESDIICYKDEEVIEGLQPHSNLKVLRVENFRGKKLSLWLSNGLYCHSLTRLALLNCKRCEQLPTLGCLPSLKSLSIDGMESIKVIGSEVFYTHDQRIAAACSSTGSSHDGTSKCHPFPQLMELSLSNMLKLEDWFDPSGSCASAFPCLEELSLINCPALVSVPSCFHSLKKLTIEGMNSDEPLLVILSNSYNLTSLAVENVEQLTHLSEPLLKCTCLQLLRIKDCNELVELPPTLQSMGCLLNLEIIECDNLTSLPDIEGLLSLSKLKIANCENITEAPRGLQSCVSIERLELYTCPKLKFIPDLTRLSRLRTLIALHFSEQMAVPRCVNHLSSLSMLMIGKFNEELDNFCGIDQLPKCLKQLTLCGWPKLQSLPNKLQSLTQLELLSLWEFEGVMALPEWLGNLSSLQYLYIWNCKNMKHLPSLETMRSFTHLRELGISECPELEERCRKEGGEEWHKISHLPLHTFSAAESR